MNLLVGETVPQARLAGAHLRLDPKEWRCIGVGEAVCGMRFETIVVLPIRNVDARIEEHLRHLHTKTSRNGIVTVL